MSKRADAWVELTKVVAGVEGDLNRWLQDHYRIGLTEYRALDLLSSSPSGELRMQELATQLMLNQSSVSRMVERLERDGLAKRDICADDKRGVYAVLTPEGRARAASARANYGKALDARIKQYPFEQMLARLR